MWALQWRYSKLRTVGVVRIAVKGERLLFTIGRTQIFDELERRRLAQIVVEAKGLEIIRVDPRDEPELHSPAHHLINESDFLGQTQRVVQRHDIAHRANAHSARPGGGTDDVEAGRRDPAFVGGKMMFDAEAVIEPEFVTQLKLAPQLFVTLVRIHARLTPDMGKMGELHFALSSSRRREANWGCCFLKFHPAC